MQKKYDVREELSKQSQAKLKRVLGPGFHKGDQVWKDCSRYKGLLIQVHKNESYYTKEMHHDLQNAPEGAQ